MNVATAIQSILETLPGMQLRKPDGRRTLDAIAVFAYGDAGMADAAAQFESLCEQIAKIGDKVPGMWEGAAHDATYIVGGERVWITITGGAYSGPMIGVSVTQPTH